MFKIHEFTRPNGVRALEVTIQNNYPKYDQVVDWFIKNFGKEPNSNWLIIKYDGWKVVVNIDHEENIALFKLTWM